ncbi:MAG TPA: SCO family protein [Usitatibacter sp.]|nr:SCO family protein [Usitatibacter sp.]
MRIASRVACTLGFVAAAAAWAHTGGEPSAPPAATPPPAAKAGTRDPRTYFTDTELVTQDGRRVRFYSEMLHDRVVVLNVMYTSCKDACPLITRQLNEVRSDLGELFGRKVQFVSITSDPARDTPRAMKKFAQEQHADVAGWSFLTGGKADVDGVLARLGAYSPEFDDHGTQLYILDVDRKRMRKMLPSLPPKAIAEAVRQVASPAS